MPAASPFRAVVFDLDGTLLHSVPSLTLALNALFAEDGLPPLSETQVRGMVGDGVGLLVARACAAHAITDADPAPRVARFMTHYLADPVRGSHLFPGADTLLADLAARGIALGLCTNKPIAPTQALLTAFGLAHTFGAVVGGDTLPQRKPDPRPLERVLALLGADKASVLYVGDSGTDVACARATGVPMALLAHGYRHAPAPTLGADWVFEGFADFAPWVLERCENARRGQGT